MTTEHREIVYKAIGAALDLKGRLETDPAADFEVEHARILDTLRADGKARGLTDFMGDERAFLGARYALACWIDELFIGYTDASWSEKWANHAVEVQLFGSRSRASKFWEQMDVVLKRPSAPRPLVAPGVDAVEAFFLCIMLGFRGKYRDNPAEVRRYVDEMRSQFTRVAPWPEPQALELSTSVDPLAGRAELLKVLWTYGGVLTGVLLAVFVLVGVWIAMTSG